MEVRGVSAALAGVVLALALANAAAWTNTRQGGGQIEVDPLTHRATITREGVTVPLWDGTHRLEDGSSLIVNGGVAVPNRDIVSERAQPRPPEVDWQGQRIAGASPCQRLVTQVCGASGQCGAQEVCPAVRDLLQREQQERQSSRDPALMTATSGQCLMALADAAAFPACHPAPAHSGATRGPQQIVVCSVLVDKVCGSRNQCADRPACAPARQILELAQQDGRANQCQQALSDESFFARCNLP